MRTYTFLSLGWLLGALAMLGVWLASTVSLLFLLFTVIACGIFAHFGVTVISLDRRNQ